MENTQPKQINKTPALLTCLGIFVIFLSFTAGIGGSVLGNILLKNQSGNTATAGTTLAPVQVTEDSAITQVAEKSVDSVVSIVITQEFNGIDWYSGNKSTTTKQLGSGSGFIISKDGLILTNRHVVSNEKADYTVVLNNGKNLPAKVLARDTVLDVAVIKVDPADLTLVPLALGDSDVIKVGQRVIAIGNSLGEFSNTVSAGIVSGLGRTILASDGVSSSESLDNVLQTDASINPGNSGGPLLDVLGNVIGVNVAVAQNAENIGFAIPINSIKQVIDSVQQFGEIRRPYLGVRYLTITKALQEQNNLPVDYGALIVKGDNGEVGVVKDSPAAKAGLRVGDIITKINNTSLNSTDNQLLKVIQRFKIGEEVTVEYLRGDETLTVKVTLEKAG